MHQLEGHFNAQGQRYAIVAARFNYPISQRLVEGAVDCLTRHGVRKEEITLAWVPGSFELPLVAKKMGESKKYDALICVGTIIRGETAHFDYVAAQAASGILQSGLSTGIPTIFSVLTTDNKEQAELRAGIKGGNIGFNGALTAIEMVNLLKKLS